MKFKDLFVPKYLHSDPHVRIKFIHANDDRHLIRQMSEKDEDQSVRSAAIERLQALERSKSATAS